MWNAAHTGIPPAQNRRTRETGDRTMIGTRGPLPASSHRQQLACTRARSAVPTRQPFLAALLALFILSHCLCFTNAWSECPALTLEASNLLASSSPPPFSFWFYVPAFVLDCNSQSSPATIDLAKVTSLTLLQDTEPCATTLSRFNNSQLRMPLLRSLELSMSTCDGVALQLLNATNSLELTLACQPSTDFWGSLPPLRLSGYTLRVTKPPSALEIHHLPPLTTGLTALNLVAGSWNALAPGVPPLLKAMTALQDLDLSGNYLTNLNLALTAATQLRSLNLANNRLTTLPAISMPALQALNISGNRLTALLTPPQGTSYGVLRQLDVSNNQIYLVDTAALASLTALEKLVFDDNAISIWSGHLGALDQLVNVSLNRALALTTLPCLFPNHPALRTISLLSNPTLTTLCDDFLAHTVNLVSLDLSYNGIATLPAALLQKVPRLSSFKITSNNIAHLPDNFFSQLPELRELFLASNNLEPVAGFASLTNLAALEILSLSNSRITTLTASFLRSFPRLQRLFVDNTPLATIEADAFAYNPLLENLLLYNLSLTTWHSDWFASLDHLAYLDISNALYLRDPVDLTLPPGLRTLRTDGIRFHPSVVAAALRLNLTALTFSDACGEHWEQAPPSIGSQRVLSLHSTTIRDLLVAYTHCTHITVELTQPRASIVIVNNPDLIDVQLSAPPLLELDLENNTKLATLPILPTDVLVISHTSLPFHPEFCTQMGTVSFVANNMLDQAAYTGSSLSTMLATCFAASDSLSFSNNEFMRHIRVVREQLGQRFILSDAAVAPEMNINGRWVPILVRRTLPGLVLEGLALTCSLNSNFGRQYLVDQLTESYSQYFRFQCACQRHYYEQDDECVPKKTFFDHPWAVAVVVLAALIVTTPLFLLILRRLRRRLAVVTDHHTVTQRLLDETQQEVVSLREAWRVDFEELNLLERIDEFSPGSFGAVYKAELGSLLVCVKIMRVHFETLDEHTVESFRQEADFLLRTKHPNLVRFLGMGETKDDPPQPFVVLELVLQGSLSELLHVKKVQLNHRRKLSLAHDVACGLAFIHALGKLHRDIKPGNVLVTSDWVAKITDFGSIRNSFTSGAHPDTTRSRRMLSSHSEAPDMSILVGTPNYMAPEVLECQPCTTASDVWSFGVTIWELAHEQRPSYFLAAGKKDSGSGPVIGSLINFLRAGIRLPIDPSIPDPFPALVGGCCRDIPEERWTMAQVEKFLSRVLRDNQ